MKTRALVEDHAALTVAAVGEVGGFQARETWTELEGGRFKVRRQDDVLQVRVQTEMGNEVTAIVGLQIRRLPRSQSYYFTCPIAGARLLKLFVVGGQLGGWKALGLDHRSRVQPQLYREQQLKRAAVQAWPFRPIARTTSEGWAGELSPASEAERIQVMAPWVRKARGGRLPSTRSRGIWDWGWAHQQPELDADELDRLGLFKEGGRRIGFFSWADKLGGQCQRKSRTGGLPGDQPFPTQLRYGQIASSQAAAEPISLARQLARGDPARGHALRPLPAVAAQCGGPRS